MSSKLKVESIVDRRLPILWVSTLTLIIIAVMLYSSYNGRSIAERYSPLVDAAMEIKLEATTAHLWFEEIISGDRYIDINVVWGHLDQAKWYANAMLDGDENEEGKFIPLDDPVLRQEIERTLQGIQNFRSLADKRWAVQSESGVGTDIDQQFDRVFNDFLMYADDVETALQQAIKDRLRQFYWIQLLLIFSVVFTSAIIILVLKRYDNRQTNDIKNLLQREDELRTSETHLRTLFEALPDLVWLKDVDGTYLSCNHKFERFFDANEEDIVGKTDYDFVNKELADSFRKNDKISMAAGKACINEEEVTYANDGHVELLETIKTPIFSKDGEMRGVLGVGRNITERKNAEDSLRRSQKMDAIGQMAGGIAHDFNNILGVILGNLSFLKRDVANNEKALKRISTAEKMSLRAADLTKQLLGFSRSEQGQKVKPTDINLVIQGMDSLITRSITPEVEVNLSFFGELWLTDIDFSDFEDALLNLILNARDAMPDGGSLTIETANKVLDEAYAENNTSAKPGEYVELSISDNGKGIAKEIVDRIFEPFFTTKPRGKGTGLGLSMVFGFIQRSNGHIKIYSEPDIGTVVRCYLPRSSEAKSELGLIAPNEVQKSIGNETVLAVDDEEDLLSLARQYLETLGYTVETASNASMALQLLTENPSIKLLFSDVVMPGGINGYELAEKATELKPDLKVLLTSGYSGKTLFRNGQAHFTANLLSKPYNLGEIAEQVRRALDA